MSRISYLKHSVSAIAVCAFTFFAIACGKSSPDPEEEKKILGLVKSEPKVKDALITDADELYVFVVDDGTKRDGYAEYLCQVLKDNQADIGSVKVVKLNSQNGPNKKTAHGVVLDESYCK